MVVFASLQDVVDTIELYEFNCDDLLAGQVEKLCIPFPLLITVDPMVEYIFCPPL